MKIELIKVRAVSLMHLSMWHVFSPCSKSILVAEYPKSGASWFCKMLSEATGIQYPQNFEFPKIQKSILHGVYRYRPNLTKHICVIRDGRDVMVSAYYHFLFKNEKNTSFGYQRYRQLNKFDDYNNIEKNLPSFIKFMFERYEVKGRSLSWVSFINSYLHRPDVLFIKYEDLLENAAAQIIRALDFLDLESKTDAQLKTIVEKFSFERMAKRKAGEENTNSYFRKGIAGDWKTKFSQEASSVFNDYGGDLLIKLKYEKNKEWVKSTRIME